VSGGRLRGLFDGDEPMAELAILLIADARAHLLARSVNVA